MFLRTNFSEDVYRTTPKTFLLCSLQARFIYFPYRFEMLYCSKKFYCEWQMFLNCCQDESLLLYQVVLLKTKPSIQKKIVHIYYGYRKIHVFCIFLYMDSIIYTIALICDINTNNLFSRIIKQIISIMAILVLHETVKRWNIQE